MLIGFLVVVIMGSLLLSYRGTQTLVALGLALTGSLLMVYGHNAHTLAFYHIGAATMLVSTLANRRIFLPRFWNKLT